MKKSIKDVVISCVKTHGPIKAGDVIRMTKRSSASVYTMLSNLLKEGTFDKLGKQYIINPSPEAQLNTMKIKSTRRKATDMEMHLGQKTAKLEAEIEELQKRVKDTAVKYYDAMAVIKYLESKIIAQFGK